MIDDIVEMILKEARGYYYLGKTEAVATVKRKVDMELEHVINICDDEERRDKEDETKG